MKHAESMGLTNRQPEKTFEQLMVAIREYLSGLAWSDDSENGEAEDNNETEQGKLSEDDEPGRVMGTFTKMDNQRMVRFRQKQIKLDELTQPGWEDATDNFPEGDKKDGTSQLRVLAFVQLQTDGDVGAPAPTSFGEHMEIRKIVPGISQMPQVTSRAGSNHVRLGSVKLPWNTSIPGLQLATKSDSSLLLKDKPVEPVSFYPCIYPPANHYIDFKFRWRHDDGSCVNCGIDRQTVFFDVKSRLKAIGLPILLCVSFFLISVTKL